MTANVSLDELLELHRGGKLEVTGTCELKTLADLRKIYTPGVARVCMHIHDHPETFSDYTMIGHTVAIVTNGTAILGLGDIGPLAGMPVMEGKAVLLKSMGGVDAFPILIDSHDPDVIVETVANIHTGFGAIMLEDIAAPECFEIEERLKARLDKPVFHDDQHGTAVVTLAALIVAMRRVGRTESTARVVLSGAGAAGIAITKMLQQYGFADITLCDSRGTIHAGRSDLNDAKKIIAQQTNPRKVVGSLADALKDADIFVGVSRKGLVSQDMVRSMAKDPIVFPMANPEGEITVEDALAAGAAVAADGRMINNALGFPGIFRGTLRAQAKDITYKMLFAAAHCLAALTPEGEILPDFMDMSVHERVACAVAEAVEA